MNSENKHRMSFTEANDILISIIKSIHIGIIAFDFNGNITIANELAKKNLSISCSLKEMSQMTVLACTSDVQYLNEKLQICLKKGREAFSLERIQHNNKYLLISGSPIINGMIITIEDVTEKVETEKSSLKALIKGQEEERKRIAKEIHDGMGPMLSAIKMHIEAVQSDLESIEKQTLAKLETTYNLIDNVANDMRSLSHDLMPKIVEDFGLVEALDSLSKTLASEKTVIDFNSNVNGRRYSKNIELNMFRIAQELVHNSLKHSGADLITIQLMEHSDSIVLMVEDNGMGVETKDEKKYGIGIRNIETRAKAMGGEFVFDSVPGAGVTATVEISR